VNRSTSQPQQDSDFSIEKYGEKTAEKKECDEQLLAEYATILGFYITSVVVLTGLAKEQGRLRRRRPNDVGPSQKGLGVDEAELRKHTEKATSEESVEGRLSASGP
jgi:hypothetical protein